MPDTLRNGRDGQRYTKKWDKWWNMHKRYGINGQRYTKEMEEMIKDTQRNGRHQKYTKENCEMWSKIPKVMAEIFKDTQKK